MQAEQSPSPKMLSQSLKRHAGAIIATVSLCTLIGATLLYLLHPKYSDPNGWSVRQNDPWITPLPHSSGWKEVSVLRYVTSKEATILSALKSKPFVVLKTRGHQKTIVLRAVVNSLVINPKTPKTIRVFQNGKSFWLVGNGTDRRDYVATKRPVIVRTTSNPEQVFVTLFSDEAPRKSH
jgi:hypothetical protein